MRPFRWRDGFRVSGPPGGFSVQKVRGWTSRLNIEPVLRKADSKHESYIKLMIIKEKSISIAKYSMQDKSRILFSSIRSPHHLITKRTVHIEYVPTIRVERIVFGMMGASPIRHRARSRVQPNPSVSGGRGGRSQDRCGRN
jgi:hypothetical protein